MKHYPQNPNNRLKSLVAKFANLPENKESCSLTKPELLLLTDHFEFEKFPDLALEAIDYAIQKFKKSPDLLVKKARLLIYNFGNKEAVDFVDSSVNTFLKPSQIDLLRLECLIAQGKTDKSLSVVSALKYKYQKTRKILSDVFYMEALAFEKMDYYDKSFEALSEALWVNPKHQDAMGKVWMTTELSKKSKESILLNQFLLKKEHYSAIAWFNLAHAYYSERMYKKAIEAFEFSIIVNEDFELAYFDLAEVCMLLGMFQKASKYLEIAFEKFEIIDLERFILMGESLVKCGEFRKARQHLEMGLLIDPSDPDLLYLMGEAYRLEHKFSLAIQSYESALELDFGRDDIHKSLGKIYFLMAEFEKAQSHFELAIDNDPFHSGYRSELASFYLNIGELEKCEKVLYDSIEELPDVELVYHYAGILLTIGKEKEGLKALGNALEENFNLRNEVYEFAPELEDHPRVEAIINYYAGEQ